ncbi:NADPH-dependent L-lysine 6-monooxygenase-like protein [Mycobacterium sp. BK558]|nr:NADPH-dependent L-lysine 6-monooxygenase-like protein [Mycobacterium sp. BK558]
MCSSVGTWGGMSWSDITQGGPSDSPPATVGTLVVGVGPAALSVLRAAAGHQGPELQPVCIVAGAPMDVLGAGRLAEYTVASDTPGAVFVEVAGISETALAAHIRPTGRRLLAACSTTDTVPLRLAAELLALSANQFVDCVPPAQVRVVAPAIVTEICQTAAGFRARVETASGSFELQARDVVLAVGGRPWIPPSLADVVGSGRDLVHSDALLRGRPLPTANPTEARQVAIVGGAHSAFASAISLLANDPEHRLRDGAIRVVHRAPIRMTYPDIAAAVADGAAINERDVCPRTKRVHRFGGLRGESARLWQRARDGDERRVELVHVHNLATTAQLCRDADLIIAATGYVNASIELVPELFDPREGRYDQDAKPRPRIDKVGQFIDRSGRLVDGLYCVGLGAGHRRVPQSGGEPSFTGSVDGVWFYQTIVAPAVVASILAARAEDPRIASRIETRL